MYIVEQVMILYVSSSTCSLKPTQGVSKLWKVLDERRGDKEELDMLVTEWELFEERVCELGRKLQDPNLLPKK